jgi:hypothetical protein
MRSCCRQLYSLFILRFSDQHFVEFINLIRGHFYRILYLLGVTPTMVIWDQVGIMMNVTFMAGMAGKIHVGMEDCSASQ